MSKIKSPREKKRVAYERDSRTAMDAPHAFRKSRPRKKARLSRVQRHSADHAVASVLKGADPHALVVQKAVRGWDLKKVGVRPLGVAVQEKHERRAEGVLPRYTLDRYRPDQHRGPFGRFIEALLRGKKGLPIAHARYLSRVLDAVLPNNSPDLAQRRWLQAFFGDEPRYEARLRLWIQELLNGERGASRRTTG